MLIKAGKSFRWPIKSDILLRILILVVCRDCHTESLMTMLLKPSVEDCAFVKYMIEIAIPSKVL